MAPLARVPSRLRPSGPWPMLSRLHGLCSWGRGKLWPEPSLTSLQDRRQKDRNKVILESDAAKKRRRNEIEIADAVIEPGPWARPI